MVIHIRNSPIIKKIITNQHIYILLNSVSTKVPNEYKINQPNKTEFKFTAEKYYFSCWYYTSYYAGITFNHLYIRRYAISINSEKSAIMNN
jgi:hypothetical protein